MLAAVRRFFFKRNVMEVDTPILSSTAPIDLHLEVMTVLLEDGTTGYLHTSAEYGMKRLLAQGSGDIYQLSHVFRADKIGRYHHPEFMMIEWYRVGISLESLIHETIDLIALFIDEKLKATYTYAEAFQTFTDIDYRKATLTDLKKLVQRENLPTPHDPCSSWNKEEYLDFIMGFFIEPKLVGLNIIRDFPPFQAALSTINRQDRESTANRFEIYFNGVELANGFQELTDPLEHRRRFEETNLKRRQLGKTELPLDEKFLSALEEGVPESCGVAVGFDRLLMLQLKKESLTEVLSLS